MKDKTLREKVNRLHNGWRAIDKLYEQYANSVGLSYTGLEVLEALYEYPDSCTQKLICEETFLPKQSVNLVIKALRENGYVEMKEQDEDRRNKVIRLNETGLAYAEAVLEKLARVEENVISHLSNDQYEITLNFIQGYQEGLQQCIDADSQDDFTSHRNRKE